MCQMLIACQRKHNLIGIHVLLFTETSNITPTERVNGENKKFEQKKIVADSISKW